MGGWSVKGDEKVYSCGGAKVSHWHDEKELDWEPGGVRSGPAAPRVVNWRSSRIYTRSDRMTYTVYKNRVHKFARVHRSMCNQPRKHGGVSRRHPPTGEYVDHLSTREAAVQEARSTGWEVKLCRYCAP